MKPQISQIEEAEAHAKYAKEEQGAKEYLFPLRPLPLRALRELPKICEICGFDFFCSSVFTRA